MTGLDPTTLMVLVPEPISEWIAKGEVISRYYNPGAVFDRVHLVLCNDDRPDPEVVQQLVGSAEVEVHNVPTGRRLLLRTGWRPSLLRGWADEVVELARVARPALVRCYAAHLNAYAAHRIRQELGIPYVVSMHTIPDELPPGSWRVALANRLIARVEELGLRGADLVLPVYESIVPYLRARGVERIQVLYNVVTPDAIRAKESYALHEPPRLLSVGRQIPGKDPRNLLRGFAQLPGRPTLRLIGSGELHPEVVGLVEDLGLADRVVMEAAVPNEVLCAQLADHDLFVAHSDYHALAKAVLEPLLAGLPVVVNRPAGDPVPELELGACRLVDGDDPARWAEVIAALLADHDERAALGRRARDEAEQRWSPEHAEAAAAAVHRSFADAAGLADGPLAGG